MDTFSIVLIVFFGAYVAIKLLGYLSRLGIKQVTARQIDQMKGIMLLDVRSDKEFKQGHIPGSIHIPLEEVGSKAKKLRKDKELVVYCQSGNRSIWAIKRLMGMGFTNLHNLKGGYHAWKRIHR
ncbi:MAG: rhodanese-like domain-containing protein [Nitrospirota bacterium]|nr:rhodanese-like domain-containing protein [Nitrospirota bacterium]